VRVCSWRGSLRPGGAAEGHLSEGERIGGKRRRLLIELGPAALSTWRAPTEQLADCLEVHGEQHREIAAQLVAQARAQQQGTPWPASQPPPWPTWSGRRGFAALRNRI